jgi:hypothetical protein
MSLDFKPRLPIHWIDESLYQLKECITSHREYPLEVCAAARYITYRALFHYINYNFTEQQIISLAKEMNYVVENKR